MIRNVSLNHNGCVWTYAGACRPGVWEVGSYKYDAFAPRVRVFPTRPSTPEDVALARLLRASGGGIDPSRLAGPVPDWAGVAPKGTIASRPAEAALRARPDLVRVLTADESVVRRILETGEVPLPSRIS
jgi:hypothetical protein